MPKLRQVRIAKGRQQKELAQKIGTDEPMMSRFENFKCLPIPSMLARLTEELNCTIDDIYEPHEIYLQGVTAKVSAPKAKKNTEVYHLTVNLPPEAREFFKTALKKCGYKDITDWANRCFERTRRQYEEILAKEKDSARAGKQKSEV